MRLRLVIGAALLAASTALYAQGEAKGDPAARRQKAREACEGARGKGTEHRDCMRRELCAQAKDPAQCEARAKEALAMREKAQAACKDKPADERRACMREQLGRKPRT